ncbi:ATP-dependent DNA ligase [Robiginitalea sp. M366]|uniref:ATP-dependent DNA ligase n=1 Tax=Robiginitalea aestuariiviva TaxID=3036903 RepID=UPI00240D113E|nr:ATP-dependent DNA ligase [Robiginitalea aestuariiviva]MDG1571209.1 ATP-dependent DNA ligase [Robiginitalea aestuariiviva]
MEAFAHLIRTLDSTNKTNVKVAALAAYFREAPDPDKVWTIAILSHRRPPRPVNTRLLREWAAEMAGIPMWLFEESYHIVGDLAETIALVLPHPENGGAPLPSLSEYLEDMVGLKPLDEVEKKAYVWKQWGRMDYYQRFVFNKFITGGFRIGISQKLMTRALAQATGVDEPLLAYRLMGNWDPATTGFAELVLEARDSDRDARPFPFYLAYALQDGPEALGDPAAWLMEHKWDGIRAQVLLRNGEVYVWSRGEELVTDQYPEFQSLVNTVPEGTVLDGEILPYPKGEIGSFRDLQKRLGRKSISAALLKKTPVILRAYDLLEWEGKDIRHLPFRERRALLDPLVAPLAPDPEIPLDLSVTAEVKDWKAAALERGRARELRSEGLMLKHRDAPYGVGRKKGDWWKWKVDPYTVDAVLTYAMRGHGRRSNLFTDYTFALWDQKEDGKRELVTFAKAYSGLTDAEFRQVDAWIKRHTLERFGPVRSVEPEQVFEIAFEGIAASGRHKSGVATRFPRIVRWRKDKPAAEADTLQTLKRWIPEL